MQASWIQSTHTHHHTTHFTYTWALFPKQETNTTAPDWVREIAQKKQQHQQQQLYSKCRSFDFFLLFPARWPFESVFSTPIVTQRKEERCTPCTARQRHFFFFFNNTTTRLTFELSLSSLSLSLSAALAILIESNLLPLHFALAPLIFCSRSI